MSKATHTPGPWFRNISAKYPVYAGPKGNHTHVASILSGADYAEGDLRLIAAAPELLAALNAVLQHCVTPHGFPERKDRTKAQQRAYNEARAAIAKATGEA